jgi:hypothetical protein
LLHGKLIVGVNCYYDIGMDTLNWHMRNALETLNVFFIHLISNQIDSKNSYAVSGLSPDSSQTNLLVAMSK